MTLLQVKSMSDVRKLSIRFYDNREVRAVWEESHNEWYFAIVDIIAAITKSESPRKYWSVLKLRLKRQGSELTTVCSQLKLVAADGKKYNTDCIPQSKVADLAKAIPNKNAITFLDWLTYSDNTIDGQSKKKARLKKCVDWSMIDKCDYLAAMERSVTDATVIKQLIAGALTDEISSREMFMKGIDYSYYYEQED